MQSVAGLLKSRTHHYYRWHVLSFQFPDKIFWMFDVRVSYRIKSRLVELKLLFVCARPKKREERQHSLPVRAA